MIKFLVGCKCKFDRRMLSIDSLAKTSHRIRRLLVANRGEIACKIIQTTKEISITTISIFTKEDCNAKHTREAHESYSIPSNSYLDVETIVKLAKEKGADAIHPGYGFLAERAEFAAEAERNGILFVGPSSSSIQLMADKLSAKQIAGACEVPSIKWHRIYDGADADAKNEDIINQLRFPVIVKPARGGGGRGTRIIKTRADFHDCIRDARSEASSLYGSTEVYIEEFIENARHLEIQVLGDKFGNVVCFPERVCSIQRRFQKIVEESPDIRLSEQLRLKLVGYAQSIAKTAQYYSAGTVEFLVSLDSGEIKFLEMNTRIQVEHALTEKICQIDLIQSMLRIAEGYSLAEIDSRFCKTMLCDWKGHAVELRVLAEDPVLSIPVDGVITSYELPNVEGCTVFSSVDLYDAVPIAFDSMLAKVVSYSASSRKDAVCNAIKALKSYWIHGLRITNIAFLIDILEHPLFQEQQYDCGFIQKVFPKGYERQPLTQAESDFLFLAVVFIYSSVFKRDLDNEFFVAINEKWVSSVEYLAKSSDEKNFLSCLTRFHRTNSFITDSNSNEVLFFEKTVENVKVFYRGWPYDVKILSSYKYYLFLKIKNHLDSLYFSYLKSLKANNLRCTAAIPGKVVKIFVQEEDEVGQNQPLVLLESMKMQNIIRSPVAGRIKKVYIQKDSFVSGGQLLVDFHT